MGWGHAQMALFCPLNLPQPFYYTCSIYKTIYILTWHCRDYTMKPSIARLLPPFNHEGAGTVFSLSVLISWALPICYYNKDDVLAIIPEPVSVTSRHKCIDQEMWKMVNNFV